jgi:hypothetical protein
MVRNTLEKIQQFVAKRGGECLSKEYKNSKTKMEWRCHVGHVWRTTYDSIHSGQWCPYCSSGLYERICRCYFEQLFKKSFPKVRPDWLKNSRGNGMELDGYCKELSLAFEHNGRQHYTNESKWSKDLEKRKEDDRFKINQCKAKGITLIIIPELVEMLPVTQLREYIKTELQQQQYPIPLEFDSIEIDTSSVYVNEDYIKYNQLKNYAISKNGKMLSKQFLGMHTPHKWGCNICGYEWKARPHNIITGGTWCPKCVGLAKGSIEEMRLLAESRGGKCLSRTYKNSESVLKWECGKCNHIWEASVMSVKNGKHWCPSCARQSKPTIEYINSLAETKGGKCLDAKDYKKAHDKLTWKCDKGHEWKASYANVRAGKWCPQCFKHRKLDKIIETSIKA